MDIECCKPPAVLTGDLRVYVSNHTTFASTLQEFCCAPHRPVWYAVGEHPASERKAEERYVAEHEESLSTISWMTMFLMSGMPMLGWICNIAVMRFYALDKERMVQVRKNADGTFTDGALQGVTWRMQAELFLNLQDSHENSYSQTSFPMLKW